MSKILENLKNKLNSNVAALKKLSDNSTNGTWILNPQTLKLIADTDNLLKQVIRLERN